MIANIIIALIGISLLILVHEFGHFITARYFNIAVHRFSIGFGPKLIGWQDRQGTEFILCPILLGGYVKFAEPSQVSPDQQDNCFTTKPLRVRTAVVAAGPLANLLLTYLLFVFLNLYGVQGLKPIIGEVRTPSPAASAGVRTGDEITAIDNTEIYTWQEATLNLVANLGRSQLPIELRGERGALRPSYIDLGDLSLGGLEQQSLFDMVGFTPLLPEVPAIIGTVLPDSPAAISGLQEGDQVLSVNNQPIENWSQLTEQIVQSPNRPLDLVIKRGDREVAIVLIPQERSPQQGFAGIGAAQVDLGDEHIRVHRYSITNVWQIAGQKTFQSLTLVFNSFVSLLSGDLSIESLSGPVSIVKYTSDSARSGIQDFVFLLSFISISLFFFNLLPVPILDGGHLLLYLIEAIKGSPISTRFQKYYLAIGTIFLLSLFIFVTFNDILRLL